MKKYSLIIALVSINLVVGFLILPGFGESSDEISQHSYAERTIQAVKSLGETGTYPPYFLDEEPKQASHGPAFIIGVVLLKNLFLPHGTPVQKLLFSHFLYFVMFQVGIVSLYFLARRWVSETGAFGTALLFNTQPLLLGHAFMNPKDVVFMSVLITSVILGLRMVDRGGKSFGATGKPLTDGVRSFFGQFLCSDVWLAGLVLGFSSAIRIAAPLIGMVVLAYILLSRKWQALPLFFAYGLIALCTMILLWPYLWPDPLGRLIGSILNSAHYPDKHFTLFNGILIEANYIPFTYLPLLLAIQLTETMLMLLLIGVIYVLKKLPWDLIVLFMIWFVLPASAIILLHVNLYNNFRQVFFLLPPLFLIAGQGLDWLFSHVRWRAARLMILFLILLPGLYANINLYPYQYVYYNQFVGGIKGAYRVFELDYWNLALKEAQSFVNESAPVNADVFVGDSKSIAQTWARPDLILNALGAQKRSMGNYDYIIVGTAQNSDKKFSEYPTVFDVERDGVPLIFVKKPK